MRSATALLLSALGIVILCPSFSWGAAKVGDDFNLQFRAVDGSEVSTQALKGKLVVVDFWATWCGPCMAMVPHMVELNQKYAGKGMQIIGISLDEDRNAMIQTTKAKGMVWPEYFDGAVWKNKIFKQYGGNFVPFTVLVSPQGKVLFADNPGAGLDQAITAAFKSDPPQLVDPAVLAQARQTLDEVEQKTAAGEAKDAIALMAKIPAAAGADAKFLIRATEDRQKLESAADKMLAEVQTQIEQAQYPQAIKRLKDLSSALAGLPQASKATAMLADVVSNPQARAAIASDEKNSRANAALDVAQRLQAQKKDELAYCRFAEVASTYPGTGAAALAQQQVSIYEKNTAFIKEVNEHAAAAKATAALHVGDSYRAAGNLDMARTKYQSVIAEYPGTSYADQAQKDIDAIAVQ